MVGEPKYDDDLVVGTILGVTVFIGLIGAGLAADVTVVLPWFAVGFGLSVIHLLYRVVVLLERLVDAN